ncbi:MAG: Asp-tRNA(Asn)/Glu-tRNA(Gln) amidotransferase subunit GatA [Patescibacteria group bacterium]|nr:Asp-tRNA(Asn)/Glu-tRNA(Gln) amidotransferase subunit GatA [Patescibacteria group bacterium]
MIPDPTKLTIRDAHAQLKEGALTSAELVKACLDRIAERNPQVNAYLEVFSDAMDQAAAADAAIAAARKAGGDFSPLLGIPCAIKDNILIEGRTASAASKMLEGYRAAYDAVAIAKLKAAGAVFLGRTNMDEFAMGGSTENSAFGPTRNPHDLERVAGGSSGGSAAAVAMDGALFALGSDTGGSIRQPASFCGVVGLKPTYGAVSRYGVIAMGSSLDQIGPIARTVSDAETVFEAIRGDAGAAEGMRGDGTAFPDGAYRPARVGGAKPVIGVPRHFLGGDGVDPAVLAAFDAALDSFRAKGYEVKDVALPNVSYALPVYYVLMPAEVSSNMARFDGMRFGLHKDGADGIGDYFESRRAGLGREVIRRILLGTYVLSTGYHDAYYNRAGAVRRMIAADFAAAFETVDLIATPTAPSPAFKVGEKASDPVAMYLEDIFTVTANLTGMPALSVPCGDAPADPSRGRPVPLPVGIQLAARHGDERALFEAGKDLRGEVQ